MAEYREAQHDGVLVGYIRASDGIQIPYPAPGNTDADEITVWLAEGGIADPALPIPPITSVRFFRDADIVTTDSTSAILYRHPVPVQTAFDLQTLVIAIDTGNGASKKWKREGFIKRLGLAAKPVIIGTITNPLGLDPGDPVTVDWTMVPSFQENDLIITVTGVAGRTIAWQVFIDVLRFTPSGI